MPLDPVIASPVIRAALLIAVFSSFGIYGATNAHRHKAAVLTGRLDHAIPFLPVFSVPYLLYLPYLFVVVAYGILVSPHWAAVAASTLAVQLAAAATYRTHQTHVPRPDVHGTDVFSRLTAFVYRYDAPYNCFPSLHVAYSLLCLYWSSVLFPPFVPLFALLTAAIVASTLFIKQHAVADVVSGTALTALTVLILGV